MMASPLGFALLKRSSREWPKHTGPQPEGARNVEADPAKLADLARERTLRRSPELLRIMIYHNRELL